MLTVSPVAKSIAGFLMRPPATVVGPVWGWFLVMTAGFLPKRLRDEFGLPFGAVERASFRASVPLVRAIYATLPEPLRALPAYRAAMRRVAGETEVPVVDRVIARLEHVATAMAIGRTPQASPARS